MEAETSMTPRRPVRLALTLVSSLLLPSCGGGAVSAPSATPPAVAPTVESSAPSAPRVYTWKKLDTVAYKGKQDDIFFVDPDVGYYVNGAGFIYKTVDGGAHFTAKIQKPGTYFRALGFIDAQNGFAGNIGPDYFPGVTDSTALYQTHDGGDTWAAVPGLEAVKGICAIDVLQVPFINAGHLDHRTIVHAAGRVGGPAWLATSLDGGATWKTKDMRAVAGMILDVKFLDARTGFVCAATDPDVEKSHALVLKTTDGGETWTKKYESARPYEDVWKCSFPSAKVGYATVQSYDTEVSPPPGAPPVDPAARRTRYVAKTTDGGETWTELPLTDDPKVREFGIGFADETTGWVGAMPGGFQTNDGGKTWTPADIGRATNKIRVLHTPGGGVVGYAIGVDVYKLIAP
jgi:photosystem II stability/assembly factor-like uncharacterized protein